MKGGREEERGGAGRKEKGRRNKLFKSSRRKEIIDKHQ
jgi:hypothetical protein